MKPRVSVVTIGHVDHGKSTLLGRLLVETGVVSAVEIAQFEREAHLVGKASFKYAWALDRSPESRERGLTLDLGYADLTTRNRRVHLIDAPGHQDFVRSMISGTAGADAALLVVDASEGIMPQTREHANLAASMGLRQVIVALNKIDRLHYEAARVGERARELRELLLPLGFSKVDVIPLSAWEGENLTRRGPRMDWYKGRTLEEALDGLESRPAAVAGALRLPIMDVLSVSGVGTVAVGRIERGSLVEGEEVAIQPAGKFASVKSIEIHGQATKTASAGDVVGVALRGVARSDVQRGDVMGAYDEPPVAVDAFEARVAITGEIGQAGPGWTATLHCHSAAVAVRLDAVLSRIDPASGEEAATPRPTLTKGDVARVRFLPAKPIVVEGASDGPALGRFALRVGRTTVGAGSVVSVTPHERDAKGPETPSFSYKAQKVGAAARRRKEEESRQRRDIHGRPLKAGGKK
ncbi:MAG: GTP-binding protein [Thermoplasmatota archaeon]